MRRPARRRRLRTSTLALPLAVLVACGDPAAADADDREIPWTYGPMSGTSSAVHLRGTGTEGGAAIAEGWHCRLRGGKQLTVTPYRLAASHPLFGKATLSVSLFDQTGKELTAFLSPTITKENATFTFEVPPDVAAQLWDLVLWYRKA